MADISMVHPALRKVNVMYSGHTLREVCATTHGTMDKNNF